MELGTDAANELEDVLSYLWGGGQRCVDCKERETEWYKGIRRGDYITFHLFPTCIKQTYRFN